VPPYLVSCPFCAQVHRSEFFDDIEEGIMACRDRFSERRQDLSTFKRENMTIRVEPREREEYGVAYI